MSGRPLGPSSRRRRAGALARLSTTSRCHGLGPAAACSDELPSPSRRPRLEPSQIRQNRTDMRAHRCSYNARFDAEMRHPGSRSRPSGVQMTRCHGRRPISRARVTLLRLWFTFLRRADQAPWTSSPDLPDPPLHRAPVDGYTPVARSRGDATSTMNDHRTGAGTQNSTVRATRHGSESGRPS